MASMSGLYNLPYAPYYASTWVPETFPDHHYPIHNTRDRIHHAFHDFMVGTGEPLDRPHADIRETMTKYYIEIELAGAHNLEDIAIRWEDQKVLLIRGLRKRIQLSEENENEQAQKENATQETDTKIVAKEWQVSENESKVHNVRGERHLGPFNRTFEFAVAVDHENSRAYLHDGLLTIVVNKKHPESAQRTKAKEIQITKEAPTTS